MTATVIYRRGQTTTEDHCLARIPQKSLSALNNYYVDGEELHRQAEHIYLCVLSMSSQLSLFAFKSRCMMTQLSHGYLINCLDTQDHPSDQSLKPCASHHNFWMQRMTSPHQLERETHYGSWPGSSRGKNNISQPGLRSMHSSQISHLQSSLCDTCFS